MTFETYLLTDSTYQISWKKTKTKKSNEFKALGDTQLIQYLLRKTEFFYRLKKTHYIKKIITG